MGEWNTDTEKNRKFVVVVSVRELSHLPFEFLIITVKRNYNIALEVLLDYTVGVCINNYSPNCLHPVCYEHI